MPLFNNALHSECHKYIDRIDKSKIYGILFDYDADIPY